VVTSGRTLATRALVGADGAKGVVARRLGLSPITLRGVAIESEVRLGAAAAGAGAIPLDTLGLDFWNSAEAELDYAWVFPKAHVLSVGAAGHERAGAAIKGYWQTYFQRQGFAREDITRMVGHTLPCRLTTAPLVAGRAVLAGDAAGMVEPFTGEGIGYALMSGRIAAEVLVQYLEGRLPDVQEYQRRVDAEILPELRRAYALACVARRVPRLTYLAFVHLPRFRNIVYALMRGERSFRRASAKLRPVEPLLRRLEPPD
jgi:flavin-dependent dehydrogenase